MCVDIYVSSGQLLAPAVMHCMASGRWMSEAELLIRSFQINKTKNVCCVK